MSREQTMLIANATILTPFEQIENGAVRVENGRVVAVAPLSELDTAGEERFDATGLLLAPGFIDLQLNGAFGHDFTRHPPSIWPVAARLPRFGVTAFLPTIITSPPAAIAAAQQALQQAPHGFEGAMPLGLHLEGPFLNPQKKGAHNAAHLLPPDLAIASEWSAETGVRLATLAPELPGALQLIRQLVDRGVVVAAGHSLASYDEGRAALAAGVRYGTHLFNAMPALHHRQPGLVAALLTDERAAIGLIADGIHVHPALVVLLWRLLGPQRLNLVTDAMAALGMGHGSFFLGDQAVHVQEGRATLPGGALAGSVLSLDGAVRRLARLAACSPREALQTVTSTPARLLGLHNKGTVSPGADADLLLLTPELEVAATFVGGRLLHKRQETHE